MSAFNEAVYRLIEKCPKGKVVSYGGLAAMLGKPRAARAVGTALRQLPEGSRVPWWRVINSRGEISMRGLQRDVLQRELLLKEGVQFNNDVVDWEIFGWDR